MNRRPIRILHVVGGMNRGGIETWLMHLLRRLDPARFRMDFMVHTDTPCPYDEEVRALGGRILPCLHPKRPWSYAVNFRRLLAACGPYDIIHSHVHHYTGCVLRLAHREGIAVRIAHSHNSASPRDLAMDLARRFYMMLASGWIHRFATHGLAASEPAAAALFGMNWKSDPRWRVLYCGINLRPFHSPSDASVRSALNIPEGAFVIGHVGRFEEQKNHRFLIDVARSVIDREPHGVLLLVGDGPLRPSIERRVAELGLSERVIFTGLQSDVSRVLQGAMDVFVMPSFYEGLSLAALEAQAAGLPCVLADGIPAEVEVVPQLLKWVSLSQGRDAWAEAILASGRESPSVTRSEALATLEASAFDICRSAEELERLYIQCVREVSSVR